MELYDPPAWSTRSSSSVQIGKLFLDSYLYGTGVFFEYPF